MASNTYAEGLRIASDLAQRAVLAESSISSLPPLASPIPALQKAFPLYISAAESYSHLLASKLVPEADKAGVKRKWRLVLERAEKVKSRIEELGGQVGRVGVGDSGEEEQIKRRGGTMNGVDLAAWTIPPDRDFQPGREGLFRLRRQPDLAMPPDQPQAEWAELPEDSWNRSSLPDERWVVNQGVGADCSVVAGLGVCLDHNRRWGTRLAVGSLYPQSADRRSVKSENGKHVLRLLLNGEWRGVIIDCLLPRTANTHQPLHATSHILDTSVSDRESGNLIGPPWIPLALKAYFHAHGGYSLRGSNPAPDIYAFTGWIPERISLREGFQREKEWNRVYSAWKEGQVMVTLGTGKDVSRTLIPLHAYAILDMREDKGERILEVFDPGLPAEASAQSLSSDIARLDLGHHERPSRRTGLFTMTWDEVCTEFDALNLNWDPALRPISVKRHWSWPKPAQSSGSVNAQDAPPRYRLNLSDSTAGSEIWILLSQHIVSKDRQLDDISLHVTEDHTAYNLHHPQIGMTSPYSNSQHILARYIVRSPATNLVIIPSRDRGLFRTDFTLQAFAPTNTSLTLDRISTTLPFSQTIANALTSRSAGGHAGWPSFGSNPQFRLIIGDLQSPSRTVTGKAEVRVQIIGDGEVPWNVKLLWSDGGLIHDVSDDSVVADSGAYSYGLAYTQADNVATGKYTAVVSSFNPNVHGKFSLNIQSDLPVAISPIPAEGAGLYHRTVQGRWTDISAAGRPSLKQYHLNPHIDLILPTPVTLQCRLHHPELNQAIPLNLTLFSRREGGGIGEQIATSGAYSDATSGVRIARTKPGLLKAGIYVLVPSGYEKGMGREKGWRVDVWADAPCSLETSR